LRLPQPDQQRAVLPRLLPRPPRLAGPHGERRDEGRRRAGDRRVRRPCRAERGVHHPERLQQAGGAGGRGRGGASRPRDRRRPAASPPGSLIGPLETAPSWSVVIPAYHEADRLPRYLAEVVAYFIERGEPWEVIVVDDGSTDDTSGVVRAMRDRHPEVRLVRHERNSGKGFAVQAGMAVARGAQRLFADADGATPIAELKRLEAALAAGADVAIGSRAVAEPGVSVVARSHRVLAGRVFNLAATRMGLDALHDTQCGFKAFSRAAAADLFPRLSTKGFGFDVELLLRARAAGWRIAEVPVNWTDQQGSKVGVLTDGPAMLWQIATARRRIARDARGRR